MKRSSILLFAASSAALAACASKDPAPIVYGTEPASTGRVYNSPDDYARVNRTAKAHTAAVVATRPAPLTPVIESRPNPPHQVAPVVAPATAEARFEDLPPAPTYISLSDPELLAQPAVDERVASRSAAKTEFVTVRSGDTVYAISRRTGASPNEIIAANRLRAPYTLTVGQKLAIPAPEEKIANRVTQPEPVRARTEVAAAPKAAGRSHVVRSGDTLYSIARSNGATVAELARANNLKTPYTLTVGQRLSVPGGARVVSAPVNEPVTAPAQSAREIARTVAYTQPAALEPERMFDWPVKGAILGKFGAGVNGKRNDGVNIAAPVGTPVRASADGEVVYRGAEVEGYGNLILIKHEDGFVTAYAHNDAMLVKKGQKVNKGQMIAKVGQTGDATQPQLHFEIRQNLKSVDPLAFLEN